jgi:hypothetical protein
MQLLTFTTTLTHNIVIGIVAKWVNLDIGHTLVTNIGLKWRRFDLGLP